MTVSASKIANYFLQKAANERMSLTPMQVIKLVYIAHGWHLGYFKTPLISERVEAWPYGPVIDSLYHGLKKFRNGPVTEYLPADVEMGGLGDHTRQLIEHVWAKYRGFSGPQLSTLTHQPDTPWSDAKARAGAFARSVPIANESIQEYYERLIESAQRQAETVS